MYVKTLAELFFPCKVVLHTLFFPFLFDVFYATLHCFYYYDLALMVFDDGFFV